MPNTKIDTFDAEFHRELSYRAWRGVRWYCVLALFCLVSFSLVEDLSQTIRAIPSDVVRWFALAMLLLPFASSRHSPAAQIYSLVCLLFWLSTVITMQLPATQGEWGIRQATSFAASTLLISFIAPLPFKWWLGAWIGVISLAAFASHFSPYTGALQDPIWSLVTLMISSLASTRVGIRDAVEVVEVRRALRDEASRRVLAYERARIARDLHDHVGARLTGIALRAERDQRRLPKEAADTLQWTRSVIRLCLEELRDSIWALNHQDRQAAEFLATVRRRVEDIAQEAGMKLIWASNDDNWDSVLAAPVALAVNSIVRESLTNVIRHAQATELVVLMHHGGDALLIEIADNGTGFAEQRTSGRGLHNLRERASELSGATVIAKRPSGGTSVRSWIPLSPTAIPPDDREMPWPDRKQDERKLSE